MVSLGLSDVTAPVHCRCLVSVGSLSSSLRIIMVLLSLPSARQAQAVRWGESLPDIMLDVSPGFLSSRPLH